MHADHETAFEKGGKTDSANLAGSCRTCNLQKGAKNLSNDAGPENFQPSNPSDRIRQKLNAGEGSNP